MSDERSAVSGGIRERIQEVLAAHGSVIKWGSDMTYCECGEPKGGFDFSTDHDAHVAGLVVEALSLEQRWCVEMDLNLEIGRIRSEPTPFPPRGELAADDTVLTSWTTPWVPVGGNQK